MINWIVYFEEKVKPLLPKESHITKTYFKEVDIINFGDLVRFIVENNNKEGVINFSQLELSLLKFMISCNKIKFLLVFLFHLKSSE